MINILIVDDSSVMRHMISNVITDSNQNINVIATASNGKEAVEVTLKLKPDVILMVLYMGQYDGTAAVRQIMKQIPTPIVILSSIGNTSMDEVFNALDAGAVDYINKPVKNQSNIRSISEPLVTKIEEAYKANITHIAEREKKSNVHHYTFDDTSNYDIILIGSSTGGPSALEQVVSNFPVNLPLSVIICQHMPENFIPTFAKRLEKKANREIIVAQDRTPFEPGKMYILPGGRNIALISRNGKLLFMKTEKQFPAYNNPSIDALFSSVNKIFKGRIIAAILTGMGRDGAQGLKQIKESGGLTVSQNESSCVVYGMPREAAKIGATMQELDLNQIAPYIISAIV